MTDILGEMWNKSCLNSASHMWCQAILLHLRFLKLDLSVWMVLNGSTNCKMYKSSPTTFKLSGEFQQNHANFQDALMLEHLFDYLTILILPLLNEWFPISTNLKSFPKPRWVWEPRGNISTSSWSDRLSAKRLGIHAISVEASLEIDRLIYLNSNSDVFMICFALF